MQVDERLFFRRPDVIQRLRFLVKYAVLAPSVHNTQPWLFRIQHDEIWIYADNTRWLKIADADKRQLHIALGACLENLLVAAGYYNYKFQLRYFPAATQPDLVAIVNLQQEKAEPKADDAAVLQAISQRVSPRRGFLKDPVKPEHWNLLEAACGDGIEMIDSRHYMKLGVKLSELNTLADQVLLTDRAYRKELAACFGQRPNGESFLAAWLKQLKIRYFDNASRRIRRNQRLFLSAPGIAILCAHDNSALMQVKCGQILERIALIATTVGLGVHPMNQILEIPEIKDELSIALRKKSLQPLCIFRLGYMKHGEKPTPRRPLEDVLI